MQACILHSGSYVPMDIRINVEGSHTIASAHFDVLGTLVNRANRWRTLKLHGSTLGVGDRILRLFEAEIARSGSESLFPLLEELSIRFIFDGDLRQNHLASMFYYIPPLQKLEVSTLFETDTIILDTLKVLKVGLYVGYSLVGLLQKCPLLKDLKVDSFFPSSLLPDFTPPPYEQDFSHPILSVLELCDHFCCGAWSSVRLPNLTQLKITPVGTPFSLTVEVMRWETGTKREFRLGELKNMLERSECTLKRIDLYLGADIPSSMALEMAQNFFGNFLGAEFEKVSKSIDSVDWVDWMTKQERLVNLKSLLTID